jgi:hypothetical protein
LFDTRDHQFEMDLGRLAPASEVTGGHTLQFLKGQGLPILKWYVLDPATSETGAPFQRAW